MDSARKAVESVYGFAFPDDLYAFHEFLLRHPDACEPFDAGADGPLEVLAGKAPRPGWDPGGDWPRYYKDPPEFFTALTGHTDGLHWGYWFDAPGELPPVVAGYFHSDGCQLSIDGTTLFEAFRTNLELFHRDALENIEYEPKYADELRQRLERYAEIRTALGEYALSERSETGSRYVEKYSDAAPAWRVPDAETRNRMGIVLQDPDCYEPLQDDFFEDFDFKPDADDVAAMTAEARELAEAGRPGSALKLGHELWTEPAYRAECYAMLELGYTMLGRPVLCDYLRRAIEFRRRCDAQRG